LTRISLIIANGKGDFDGINRIKRIGKKKLEVVEKFKAMIHCQVKKLAPRHGGFSKDRNCGPVDGLAF
jgi:hypothetical protein